MCDRRGGVLTATEATGFVWTSRFSADHQSILSLEAGCIVRTALTGEVISRLSTPAGHHDFVELPSGELAYLSSTVREWNGWEVVGDQIVVLAADGAQRVAWDAFDDLTPVVLEHWSSTFNPVGAEWTHANGLDYDADTDTFLVSSFYLQSIYSIDASNGDILWQLGGDGGDFSFLDDRGFGPQHAPQRTADGVQLFDNGSPTYGSRVVQYALDTTSHEATVVAEYPHPTGAWSGTFTDATSLGTGGVASTWAERGEAIVFNEAGQVAWHAQAGTGSMIFGAEVFDTFYP
ncbi:MAG: hypothetical protein EXR69_16435 [Myxococcales bacterium]|nr:hypothetical protein [Myxococcales bacterium]